MRPLLFSLALVGLGHAAVAQTPSPAPVPAQTPAPAAAPDTSGPIPVLTLDEALALARSNNPTYQQTRNNRDVASAQLRTTYGSLLPSVDANFGTLFREGRQQFFGGQAFGATSDVLSSSYDLTLTAQYGLATFINPRAQRANVRAADAEVTGAGEQLRTGVAQQYFTVLQQQARAVLQDTLLATTQTQLELARAREAVGSATLLDVRRAEVAVGQQQVASLQAHNLVEVEKLRLFQQLGVQQPPNVRLTSEFPVTEPKFTAEELLQLARRANPTLNAARARESAANLGYRSAQSEYTPTLRLQTGWGGYTNQYTDEGFVLSNALQAAQSQCFSNLGPAPTPDQAAACENLALTPQQRDAALGGNDQFPFSFQRNPWEARAVVSIPIFNGFTREQRVQEAAATRADARYGVRAQELALTATVTAAYLNLVTSVRSVAIQEANARAARDALTLAEERFRVGANSFLDVTQARSDYERAETDLINARYDFQRNFAALESAVGRPLR
jgi:outer membrane protein